MGFLSLGRKNKEKRAYLSAGAAMVQQTSAQSAPARDRDIPNSASSSFEVLDRSPARHWTPAFLSSSHLPTDFGEQQRAGTPTSRTLPLRMFFRSATDVSKIPVPSVNKPAKGPEVVTPYPRFDYPRRPGRPSAVPPPRPEHARPYRVGELGEPPEEPPARRPGHLPSPASLHCVSTQIPTHVARQRARSMGDRSDPMFPHQAMEQLPPLPPLPRLPKVPRSAPFRVFDESDTGSLHSSKPSSGSSTYTRSEALPSPKALPRTVTPSDRASVSPTKSLSRLPPRLPSLRLDTLPKLDVQAPRAVAPKKGSVPELDKTWEKFLNEAHEEKQTWGSKTSLSTIASSKSACTNATVAVAERITVRRVSPLATTSKPYGSKPLAPPPNQPLPPLPPPSNIPTYSWDGHVRTRSQTLVLGNASVVTLPPVPPLRLVDKTKLLERGMPTPPTSPNEDKMELSSHSSLDVIISAPTNGDTVESRGQSSVTPDPGMLDSNSNSSLPYLKSRTPTPETERLRTVSASSSFGDSEGDYSKTASELSLSLFPEPPTNTVIPPSLSSRDLRAVLVGKEEGTGPIPEATPELLTPPITPNGLSFPLPPITYSLDPATVRQADISASASSRITSPDFFTPYPQPPFAVDATRSERSSSDYSRQSSTYRSSEEYYAESVSSKATTIYSTPRQASPRTSQSSPKVMLNVGSFGGGSLHLGGVSSRMEKSHSHRIPRPFFSRMTSYTSSSGDTEGRSYSPYFNPPPSPLPPLPPTLTQNQQLLNLAGALRERLDAGVDPSQSSPSSPLVGGVEWGRAL